MIELRDVGKDYGANRVGPLSFRVERGSITGLLGPNGSGKTTTLCRMVELLRGDGATFFGDVRYSDLAIPQQSVGIMFDGVPAHPGRKVVNHLRLAATTSNVDTHRCDHLMEDVGLGSVPELPISKLSLGMRQRLGIACALIGDPDYLILDEPSNGLDPSGRIWFRDLLQSLALDGRAILLSTHNLDIVEMIADRVVLISNGRIVANSTLQDFVGGSSRRSIEVKCRRPSAAADALTAAGIGRCGHPRGETLEIMETSIEEVVLCLASAGVDILAIRYVSHSLEDVYVSMMIDTEEAP